MTKTHELILKCKVCIQSFIELNSNNIKISKTVDNGSWLIIV